MKIVKFNSSEITEGSSYASLSDGILAISGLRTVDVVVIDNDGRQVFAPMRYIESSDSTQIDLSSFNLSGVWTAQELLVQDGKDADIPVDIDDVLKLSYALSSNGSYKPMRMFQRSISMESTFDFPFIGKEFYASGVQQLVNGRQVQAIIPANGQNRQYVGTQRINRDCLHHFQVWHNSNVILESILDYQDFQSGSSNLGQIYYFPYNLKAYDEVTGSRNEYSWRARLSYKQIDETSEATWPDNLVWSEWSQFFTFKVNVPPGVPIELSVKDQR